MKKGNQKKDGLYQGKIHGSFQVIKIIDGKPHTIDREKGKYKWFPTVMEESRLKKFRPISEEEVCHQAVRLSFIVKSNKLTKDL